MPTIQKPVTEVQEQAFVASSRLKRMPFTAEDLAAKIAQANPLPKGPTSLQRCDEIQDALQP
jgi:hypothetical protein